MATVSSGGDESRPRLAPRYAEIPTFMRVPYCPGLVGADIALVGVPYDGAVTNRPGARHGPREVRNQSSLMRAIHPVWRSSPFEGCRVVDAGDVLLSAPMDAAVTRDDITGRFEEVAAAGAVALAVGGDHSVTFPILRALSAQGPLGLLHVDAHTDTWGDLLGSRFSHGSPIRLAIEAGLIDPHRTVQIGIRGAQNGSGGWDYAQANGIRIIAIEEVEDRGIADTVAEARAVVGDGPSYLTFDIDALDPVFAPGTGTPEAGGLSMREAMGLVRGFDGLTLVGADLVEVSPPFDAAGLTALNGATLMYEILCLLGRRHVAVRAGSGARAP